MTRRPVRWSPDALERAQEYFPIAGAADGRPSWELFERTLLRAAEEAFGRDFEGLATEEPGYPVRYLIMAATPLFPSPVLFFGMLVDDAVEVVDIDVDEGYTDLVGDDPDD